MNFGQKVGNGLAVLGIGLMSASNLATVPGASINLHQHFDPANASNATCDLNGLCPPPPNEYSYYDLMQLGGTAVSFTGLVLLGIGGGISLVCAPRGQYDKINDDSTLLS